MKLIGNLNKKLEEHTDIFRIVLLDRFYSMLEKKELDFVEPNLWEDPLENLIFNARIIKSSEDW
jgi:hypothetical protein